MLPCLENNIRLEFQSMKLIYAFEWKESFLDEGDEFYFHYTYFNSLLNNIHFKIMNDVQIQYFFPFQIYVLLLTVI